MSNRPPILKFPSFDGDAFPAPVLTLEEWIEWIEWYKREMVSPERLEEWINDPDRQAVPVPFVL